MAAITLVQWAGIIASLGHRQVGELAGWVGPGLSLVPRSTWPWMSPAITPRESPVFFRPLWHWPWMRELVEREGLVRTLLV